MKYKYKSWHLIIALILLVVIASKYGGFTGSVLMEESQDMCESTGGTWMVEEQSVSKEFFSPSNCICDSNEKYVEETGCMSCYYVDTAISDFANEDATNAWNLVFESDVTIDDSVPGQTMIQGDDNSRVYLMYKGSDCEDKVLNSVKNCFNDGSCGSTKIGKLNGRLISTSVSPSKDYNIDVGFCANTMLINFGIDSATFDEPTSYDLIRNYVRYWWPGCRLDYVDETDTVFCEGYNYDKPDDECTLGSAGYDSAFQKKDVVKSYFDESGCLVPPSYDCAKPVSKVGIALIIGLVVVLGLIFWKVIKK